MTSEEAKKKVQEGLYTYLLEHYGIDGNSKKPFKCLNPQHTDHKPSMSVHTRKGYPKCHCFSCEADYDTFDLISLEENISGAELFKRAYEIFGLNVEGKQYQNKGKNKRNTQYTTHNTQYTTHNTQGSNGTMDKEIDLQDDKRIDYTDIVSAAHKVLMESPNPLAYLQEKRALSRDIIERYKIGYAPKGYNDFVKDFPQSKSDSKKEALYRLILPYIDENGRYTYFCAEINDRKQTDDYNKKYKLIKKSTALLFNERYIRSETPPANIFVCEGIYDALSVEDVGGAAIALNGIGATRLINLCKKYKPKCRFILSLDNDKAGKGGIERLTAALTELDIPFIVRTSEDGKDFNDALKADRDSFKEFIERAVETFDQEEQERKEAELAAIREDAVAYHLQGFLNKIAESKTAACYSTGFESLDKVLDGGLYAGLYCIGAISSLGKTTFCLQLADTVAQQGQDIMFYSLEMARAELIAKSISRLTLINGLEMYGDTKNAKTTRGILTGARYEHYRKEENELIQKAINDYSEYAKNIYITEGIGNVGIEEIRERVKQHISITGKTPLLIIDYLQILSPYDMRATDKQNTDKAVLELKRLSRDYNMTIIGISSFNRDNYTAPVNLASFKESGAIEYGSDVLIGLQYEGMDYKEGEKDPDRQKRVRSLIKRAEAEGKAGRSQRIQVKILKNRNGSKGSATLAYFPMFNYLKDTKQPTDESGNEDTDEEDGIEWETKAASSKTKKKNKAEAGKDTGIDDTEGF